MAKTLEEIEQERKAEEERIAAEAKQKELEAQRAKELEGIPEGLRGKTQKELADLLLETSLQAEREKRGREEREAELERLRPSKSLDQLSETERKALREKEFITDPTSYMDKQFEARMRPLTEGYFSDRAETIFRLAKKDKEAYPEFEKFEKDIKATLEKMPIEVRANPQAIDWAYKMVEYPELKKRDSEARARGGLHSETGGTPAKEVGKKRELDEEEKAVARKFFGDSKDPEADYVAWSEKRGVED